MKGHRHTQTRCLYVLNPSHGENNNLSENFSDVITVDPQSEWHGNVGNLITRGEENTLYL